MRRDLKGVDHGPHVVDVNVEDPAHQHVDSDERRPDNVSDLGRNTHETGLLRREFFLQEVAFRKGKLVVVVGAEPQLRVVERELQLVRLPARADIDWV